MSLYEELKTRGISLLMRDDERLPLTVDHNDDITALAFLIGEGIEFHGKIIASVATKTACETLFALGYQAGLAADRLDPNVWDVD